MSEMSDDELRTLVSADRARRVATRVAGRIKAAQTHKKVAHKIETLETIGVAPELITKLRATGKSDSELIAMLRAKGIIS